jgi:hypothetical protein
VNILSCEKKKKRRKRRRKTVVVHKTKGKKGSAAAGETDFDTHSVSNVKYWVRCLDSWFPRRR